MKEVQKPLAEEKDLEVTGDSPVGNRPLAAPPSSLVDRVKAAWNSRTPRWYAKMIPGQHVAVDKLVSLRLETFLDHLTQLEKEDSELAYRIAELSAQIIQLNRRLSDLEESLDRLEADSSRSGIDREGRTADGPGEV